VSYNDVIRFLVDNYNGDLSFFEHPLVDFDLATRQVFPTNSNVVMAKENETLF